MPELGLLDVDLSSKEIDYIPQLADVVSSRLFPRLQRFKGFFHVAPDANGTGRNWESGKEREQSELLEDTCLRYNLETYLHWEASDADDEPSSDSDSGSGSASDGDDAV